MGKVELAIREEGRFRRLYAVKRLRSAYREDAESREMFLEEARIAGLLRHPNAVSVLDVGEDERGPFLVMDYVEGTSVGQMIARAATQRVPLQIALRIAIDAAQGLHAAHDLRDARGRPLCLVHRDVSPQNLLVGFDGVTRVTDFGIAKALGRTTRTATGVLKGKYGYLSPEQLRFDEPDRRSDVFSLGVVLFELLSGQRLYKNVSGMDGVRRILNEPPPDIGEYRDDVSPELVSLLFSMLAKDPAHRPGTALGVARSLEPVVAVLVESEGRAEVSQYLDVVFADERRANEERVAQALVQATGLTKPEEEATIREARPASRRATRIAVALLAAALLLATGGGIGFLIDAGDTGADSAATVDATRAPDEPVRHTETAESRESAGVDVPVMASDALVDDPEGSGVTEAPHETVRPEARAAPRARAASRRSGRRPRDMREMAPEGGSGVPMWEWQP